jgi:hypothetical protein
LQKKTTQARKKFKMEAAEDRLASDIAKTMRQSALD